MWKIFQGAACQLHYVKLQPVNAPVKGLDWSGVDFTPKSTPYVKKAVELQGSNAAPV